MHFYSLFSKKNTHFLAITTLFFCIFAPKDATY